VDKEAWASFTGQAVVVDTDAEFVYLGVLDAILDQFLVLKEADVHDRRESPSTKEQYIMDAKRFGVRPNRKEVRVRLSMVVSLSRLEDVILY
jgi:hypothetical protein